MNTAAPHFDRAAVLRLSLGFGVALVSAASTNEAAAATLVSLAASMSLFAAFAALLVLKGWPPYVGVGVWWAAAGLLALTIGASLLWRSRKGGIAWGAVVPRSVCDPGPVLQSPQSANVVLPEGVDRALLLTELRQHFVGLQAAWDTGEHEAMQAMTTPNMLEELCAELASCQGSPNHTEVVTLHVRLLAFDDFAGAHVVSVDFSGLIRESADQGATPFRELWMLTRSKSEPSGWRLARHQALL